MNQANIDIKTLQKLSQQIPEKMPYVKMLLLFGSRARGDIHEKSDWDFGILYNQEIRNKYCQNQILNCFEISSILENLFSISEAIDVVNLNNCSPIIADRVATDGILLYEIKKGLFEDFKQKSLLSDDQKRLIRQELKKEIDDFLKDWGLIA